MKEELLQERRCKKKATMLMLFVDLSIKPKGNCLDQTKANSKRKERRRRNTLHPFKRCTFGLVSGQVSC